MRIAQRYSPARIPEHAVFFQRYYLDCLAHASYLIADDETRVAAVIDPQRDIDLYLSEAETRGFQIRYVVLTHFHADFVAGHIELRDRTAAKIYLGEHAEAEYEFTAIKDGDMIQFGQVRLKILETPGHTPEGISIVVYDVDQSDLQPHGVLTGDTLFVGDVGRPDLLATVGIDPYRLADQLYDSLHLKLLPLPDKTIVYPAHGAGSLCGRSLGTDVTSTIGEEKAYNYALQPMGKHEFRRLVTADQPKAPRYFVHDSLMNRKSRTSLDASVRRALRPLDLVDVLQLRDDGVQLVDFRVSATFAAAHLKGSLNIGLNGQFATWCGSLLHMNQPIIVIGDVDLVEEAIVRLGRIGFDQVLGYLEHGPKALGLRPDVVNRLDRITARALYDLASSNHPMRIVDVRTSQEWSAGHVPDSENIPLNEIEDRLEELRIDRHKAVVVHCQTGYRSSAASSLLQNAGCHHVMDLVGGIGAWLASDFPIVGTDSSDETDTMQTRSLRSS